MSRSAKRGPFIHASFLKKTEETNQNGDKKVTKIWSRSSTIFPQMIGHAAAVHGGRKHILAYVIEDMVGHKLEGFTLTRTFKGHIRSERTSKGK